MDTLTCSVTWDGEEYEVQVAAPANAALTLEAFLGVRPGLRPLVRSLGLALFDAGGRELEPHDRVQGGDDLVLRPRVLH